MWIDCHAHIDELAPQEQAAVVGRAAQAGVNCLINAADDEASCARVLETVGRFPGVYGNLGIHPHHAKDVTEETYRNISAMLDDKDHRKTIIGVGEIGLDFYYGRSEREVQIRVFERFMEMALQRSLPVIIHQRDSAEQTVASIKPFCDKGLRGMIHCFSGTWEFARQCLEMGLYLSFSGIVTFRKAAAVQEAAQKAPADRILLETDSPYLAPEPLRGKTNEPAYVIHTAAKIAQLRGMSPEELSAQTRSNCRELFGLHIP